MNKFQPNQRVVLAVDTQDIVHVSCSGVPLESSRIYHIEAYDKTFNDVPMVRLRECKGTLYAERLFKAASRKRITSAVAYRMAK